MQTEPTQVENGTTTILQKEKTLLQNGQPIKNGTPKVKKIESSADLDDGYGQDTTINCGKYKEGNNRLSFDTLIQPITQMGVNVICKRTRTSGKTRI